jgi:hypothetical protein
MKRPEYFIDSALDDDRRVPPVDSTVQRAIHRLVEEEGYHKFGKLALDYDEWVSGESDGISVEMTCYQSTTAAAENGE